MFVLLPIYSFSFELKSSIYYNLLFKKSLKRIRVEKIDLRYNEITVVGANFLAVISPLSQLKSLILRHNILGDAGTMALARSSSFPSLEEMQLGWTETRDAGALAFGSSGGFKKLKKLDLRGNFISNKTKEELRKSLGHLKTLKLF